ncbi:MAG: Smr/MutS family protein [Steroidobacterales bacterium]
MTKRSETLKGLSADELAFREAMRDVRPLPPSAATRAPAIAAPRRPLRKAAAAASLDLDTAMPLINSDGGATVGPEEVLSYRRPGVRDQVLRRLRRGLIPLEAEMDLHGLSQSVARQLTAQFIDSSRQAGLRCVRIIHGKGARSGTRGAVLKSALNEWLRRHPDVIAFASARPIDGGTGAAYVLLRA